jgi:hypothetical protein
MKLFTRLFTLSGFLLAFMAGQSQDLAVTTVDIGATSTNEVPPNYQSTIFWTIKNIGTTTINDQSMIFVLGYTINGTVAFSQAVYFTGAFAPGDSINLNVVNGTTGQPVEEDFSAAAVGSPFVVCGFILPDTSGTLFPDINLFNNNKCETYTINPNVSNDWGITSMFIGSPYDVVDSFDINNCPKQGRFNAPEIDSIMVTLSNDGELTYNQGGVVYFDLIQDLDTNLIALLLPASIGPGETLDVVIKNPSVNNFSIIKKVSQTLGSHNVCLSLRMPNDFNEDNNDSCDIYKLYDTFNPHNKTCWAVGQAELYNTNMSLYTANDLIYINGIESKTNITITDMNGRVVKTAVVSVNSSLDINNLTSGIYVVKAEGANGEMLIQRISQF